MKLQLCRAYDAKGKVMEKFFRLINVTLPLVIVFICFFGYVLYYENGIFRELQAALLSVQWILLVCIAVWCGSFIFLTFSLNDLPLIGLLLIAIAAFFIGYALSLEAADAIILLAGVTLGKGARFFAGDEVTSLTSKHENKLETPYVVYYFLVGVILLLAFSSWWHLDVPNYFYQGLRWTGLWDNPNIYGMLMGAGVVLAIGLLAHNAKLKIKNSKTAWFLTIAVGMMVVGLVMSYSRGAWLGAAVGLLYLAWNYGKLKWRYVLPGVAIAALVVCFFWGSTADDAPWYIKRADLSRPSAQHRAAAWLAGLEIMRDHPFGVGWNNAVSVYDKNYSPPEGGAAAITTNDYLMLGTELGIPALVCFVAYVGLCFRKSPRLHLTPALSPFDPAAPAKRGEGVWAAPSSWPSPPVGEKGLGSGTAVSAVRKGGLPLGPTGETPIPLWQEKESLRSACLAGALVFVVAFWFDGGLFKLPTAAVFWVLLELGAARKVDSGGLMVDRKSIETPT